MSSIHEQFLPIPRGGILYDAARLRKPEAAMITREYWRSRGALDEVAGGRGTVSLLHTPEGDWVLRHYRRGGWAAKLSADRYVWTGADTTRSFREWRLLAWMYERGLPVPAPIAASYERSTFTYRADIITALLPNARTLTDAITSERIAAARWQQIGETIARFHAAGVQHADLNANNILLAGKEVYLLDFDRGQVRQRGEWERAVIARLKRSLDKVKSKDANAQFTDGDWHALERGVAS